MTRGPFQAKANGSAFDLRIDGDTISFCDGRGARKFDLDTGNDVAMARPCATDEEGNVACDGLPLEVSVRMPGLGPDDLVEAGGNLYPLKGHVHDCAADGSWLAIGTNRVVALIDTTRGGVEEIEHEGAEHIRVTPRWIAWSRFAVVGARRR